MSAIFSADEEQQRLAAESLVAETHGGLFRLPTQVLPLERFYPAEPYHQKYYLRHHSALMEELTGLFPDETDLIRSTAAARLNGALAGFGAAAELVTELTGPAVPARVAERLATLAKARRRLGGL